MEGEQQSPGVCDILLMTWQDGRTWGGRREGDELHPIFCVVKVSDVLYFEATHERESFNSFVAKQVYGMFKEGLFQKKYLTENFAWDKGHPPFI